MSLNSSQRLENLYGRAIVNGPSIDYLLGDFCNQKGGFRVENTRLDLLLHVTCLIFFLSFYFILLYLMVFPGYFFFISLTFLSSFPPHVLCELLHKAQLLVLSSFCLLLISPSVLTGLYDLMPSKPTFPNKGDIRRHPLAVFAVAPLKKERLLPSCSLDCCEITRLPGLQSRSPQVTLECSILASPSHLSPSPAVFS